MYIDKIDELIDSILDKFYYKEIKSVSQFFEKIKKDRVFDKYYEKINSIIYSYIKGVDMTEIKKIISQPENISFINEVNRRYLAYYCYMYIGYYVNDKEVYINNLLEISKQTSSNKSEFMIKNFYNSDNNATLIKLYDLIRNIVQLVNIDDPNKINDLISKNDKYLPAAIFLNDIGNEHVMTHFVGNTDLNLHNIIKTLIFREIYLKQEKNDLFQIITAAEQKQGEFKYIDIVVPRINYIDYSIIESLLSAQDVKRGIAQEIWELLTEFEILLETTMTPENKIIELLDKQIVIPIVDDFLRYHKNTETYDKSANTFEKNKIDALTKIDQREKSNKKDNTKIRYIVTKVNKIADLYSKAVKNNPAMKKELDKIFYQPLIHRKAIIINEIEELNIINKLEIQGKTAIENNEYYSDLKAYRTYPYINFHEFKKYGFGIKPNRTIDAIRFTNFEFKEQDRFAGLLKNTLQMRVAAKDTKVNIVGVVIPSMKQKLPIQCIRLKNINNVGKENGFAEVTKILNSSEQSKTIYWLFDINKDVLHTDVYEEVSSLNFEEYCKLLLSKIYDELIQITFDKVVNKIGKEQSYYNSLNILDKMEENLVTIPYLSPLYIQLQKIIYYDKAIKAVREFDKNENIIPGITGEIIKLPVIKEDKEKEEIIHVTDETKKEEDQKEFIIEGAICQHFLSWGKLIILRNKNPNRFNQLFFEFFKKYVTMNSEQDFICKSCSSLIDIKKYVSEYQPGGDTYALSLAISVPLEEMAEYEKYNKSIKYIDKLIERICYISKIVYYIGNDANVKNRRQNITKEIIDLIILQHKTLQNDYNKRRERGETSSKLYGVSRDLSNFFLFPLTNDIFVYSSKDIDKFKQIKINNVITLILFTMINELNLNQILHLAYDKTCNYFLFEKYGFGLFDGLMIRNNNGNDLVPIKNYKLLCFVIYYLSCVLLRFKVWLYKYSVEQKISVSPLLQKIIIHTLVELINSILEVNTREDKNYLYEITSTKFFVKLRTVYNDTEILEKLAQQSDKKVEVDKNTKKVRFINKRFENIPLTGTVEPYTNDMTQYLYCIPQLHEIKREVKKYITLDKLNKLTNCPTGEFHKWNSQKDLKCTRCDFSLTAEALKDADKDDKKILDAVYNLQLKKLAAIFCPSGLKHVIDPIKQECVRCHKSTKGKIEDTYNEKELNEMMDNLLKKQEKKSLRDHEILKEQKEYILNRKKKVEKLDKKLSSQWDKNIDAVINQFIDLMESIIGVNINVNNKNLYLRQNIYIVDHDYSGNSLKEPIIIQEKDGRVSYNKMDPYFKTSVLYYKNKAQDIVVYYDAVKMHLLGYKQSSKDYVKIQNSNKYIKVNISMYNKIKYLGFNNNFINILDEYKDLNYIKDNKEIMKILVSNIIRNRINELKKIGGDIQKIIYQIKFKYEGLDILPIAKKYSKIFKDISLSDPNDKKSKVFKYWKLINESIFFEPINKPVEVTLINNVNKEPNYIDKHDVIKYGNNDTVILFYIISELIKLFKLNTDKFTKTQLVYLVIDIFDYIYNIYFVGFYSVDLNFFKYILDSSLSISDENMKNLLNLDDTFTELTEEDIEKRKEQEEVDQESWDSLDVDIPEDFDADVDGDMEVNFEGVDVGEDSELVELHEALIP